MRRGFPVCEQADTLSLPWYKYWQMPRFGREESDQRQGYSSEDIQSPCLLLPFPQARCDALCGHLDIPAFIIDNGSSRWVSGPWHNAAELLEPELGRESVT